jgi:L-aspartate oxidase
MSQANTHINLDQLNNTRPTHVLIIGSGLAGMLSALNLSKFGLKVVIACKGKLIESNTAWAQGGLAAVLSNNVFDSPDRHLEDTLNAGAGLVDRTTARDILQDGKVLIEQLNEFGIQFDITKDGGFDLAREGGHSQARVLHCKDTTGKSIAETLANRVQADPNISVIENLWAEELIIKNGKCVGAYFRKGSDSSAILASYVILATGGLGQAFKRTTNPWTATGDGIAIAYRAGAKLADMEFVQFHPTALSLAGAPAALITEAVRGAGAIMLDGNGERFMNRFHKDGELATRDVVARAINQVMQEQNLDSVFLDLRPIGKDKLESHFPNVLNLCKHYGIDPLTQPIPIAPAAHYFMGGILATSDGKTSIDNLYAIGECATTGLHGANRLASNSLLEAGVMACRAAKCLASEAVTELPQVTLETKPAKAVEMINDTELLRNELYKRAGLLRNEEGLKQLLQTLSQNTVLGPADTEEKMVAANLLTVAKLITKAALIRQESRGAHYRLDYPAQNDLRFRNRIWLSQNGYGFIREPKPSKSQPAATAKLAAARR